MSEQSIYELNRIQQYIMQMRPILKKRALFSDGTEDYRIPPEPEPFERVTIRFRSAKSNVDAVWLNAGERKYRMQKVETEGAFDFYSVDISLEDQPFSYYFEVVTGMLRCYYDRYGVTPEIRPQYSFCIVPGFSTPKWAKGAVMYQILVDRFYNGDPGNDVLTDEYFYIRSNSRKVENWSKCPENFSVAEFYGGDLEGVRQKLDYLQELGIEVIYFNPLFVSPSNHKYDIQDYDHIDPHYGKIVVDEGELLNGERYQNSEATRYISRVTDLRNLEASDALFAQLVSEAHARGIRVILDGVFNHCGSFNKWLDREKIYNKEAGYEPGAYREKESPYHDFFRFYDENHWPDNCTYDGWWGHDTLPKLNYESSEKLRDYILKIAAKWVSAPYNADGWRLDVAADLGHSPEYNHQFWREFRRVVKEANPEAIILAEHYGDPRSWLEGDQWDTVMNYDAFMEPVTWFFTGMEKHSDDFKPGNIGKLEYYEGAMRHYMASFMTPSLQCAMNELSNHDHSRFLTRTNHKVGRVDQHGSHAAEEGINKAVFREAVVVQMTWPGAPTVYYGDEAGVCGFTDPDNRRTYPWGHEDKELIAFHREMIRIHKENPALKTGSLTFLNGADNQLCYARFNRQQQFVIIINNDERDCHLDLSVWAANLPRYGQLERVMLSYDDGYNMNPVIYEIRHGRIEITLPKHSAAILKNRS
ncbi:MAG: glycoside hydrolase family 13 protein [Lachnospiraceae bacterium]|nr:glycoside hydrolase family 13 protein [Lachnospiraceae bacterium]